MDKATEIKKGDYIIEVHLENGEIHQYLTHNAEIKVLPLSEQAGYVLPLGARMKEESKEG